jgi:hypothetical protein
MPYKPKATKTSKATTKATTKTSKATTKATTKTSKAKSTKAGYKKTKHQGGG